MSESGKRATAILLAAGKGSRMGSDTRKQYLELDGMPLYLHALKAMENSGCITDIVLVVPSGDEENCRKEVQKFLFAGRAETGKLRMVTAGGRERYDSVYRGLKEIRWSCDLVYIHDGARPFLEQTVLERLEQKAMETGACVAAVPSKDTIKLAAPDQTVASTPDRSLVWSVQTPQVFERELITEAYEKVMDSLSEPEKKGVHITDDAMVVESMTGHRISLVMGSYRNMKVTTPEDLIIAEAFAAEGKSGQGV